MCPKMLKDTPSTCRLTSVHESTQKFGNISSLASHLILHELRQWKCIWRKSSMPAVMEQTHLRASMRLSATQVCSKAAATVSLLSPAGSTDQARVTWMLTDLQWRSKTCEKLMLQFYWDIWKVQSQRLPLLAEIGMPKEVCKKNINLYIVKPQ